MQAIALNTPQAWVQESAIAGGNIGCIRYYSSGRKAEGDSKRRQIIRAEYKGEVRRRRECTGVVLPGGTCK